MFKESLMFVTVREIGADTVDIHESTDPVKVTRSNTSPVVQLYNNLNLKRTNEEFPSLKNQYHHE